MPSCWECPIGARKTPLETFHFFNRWLARFFGKMSNSFAKFPRALDRCARKQSSSVIFSFLPFACAKHRTMRNDLRKTQFCGHSFNWPKHGLAQSCWKTRNSCAKIQTPSIDVSKTQISDTPHVEIMAHSKLGRCAALALSFQKCSIDARRTHFRDIPPPAT